MEDIRKGTKVRLLSWEGEKLKPGDRGRVTQNSYADSNWVMANFGRKGTFRVLKTEIRVL